VLIACRFKLDSRTRVRIMSLFIESPLLDEVSLLTCNDHLDSFLTDSSWIPRGFRIHREPVPYHLLSYDTLTDFFFAMLSISLVSLAYIAAHRSYYAVLFFSDWLFCFDTLSLSSLVHMFHSCHGSLQRSSSSTNILVLALYCVTQ